MIPAPLDPARDGWPHGPGRLVLFGPPGTGKTRSVLHTWLVPALRARVPPEDILAVSFTRAAAGEIAERLARELGCAVEDVRECSRTIHSEAFRMVRDVRPALRLRGARDEAPRGAHESDGDEEAKDEGDLRKAMLGAWSLARNLLHEDLSEVALPEGLNRAELEADREAYEHAKSLRNEIDFTDMLSIALNEGYVRSRQLVIVDEAQDLSPLQWQLVARWGSAAQRVVLVGDPDQAIHEWCGADAGALARYAMRPGFAARRLARSYRVPAVVHQLARAVILRNEDRIDAPYEPDARPGEAWDASPLQAAREALDAWRRGESVLWLARTTKLLKAHGTELVRQGVPFTSERGYSPLGAPTAVAAARAVVAIRAGARAAVEDVRYMLEDLPARGFFPPRAKKETREEVGAWPGGARVARQDLEALGMELGQLLAGTLTEALTLVKLEQRAADLARLVDLHGPEVLGETPPPQKGARGGAANLSTPAVSPNGRGGEVRRGRVTLTTMHASKGREAALVVLDLEAPRVVARELDERAEAERRLLYVGLTRVRGRLLLLRAPAERDLGHVLGLPSVRRLPAQIPAGA